MSLIGKLSSRGRLSFKNVIYSRSLRFEGTGDELGIVLDHTGTMTGVIGHTPNLGNFNGETLVNTLDKHRWRRR